MEAIKPEADLTYQQQELENEMTMMGIDAFRQKMKGAVEKGVEDRTTYGLSLLDGLLPKVVTGIENFITDREAGKARNKGAAYKYLKKYEGRFDAVSFIALRLVLSNLSSLDVKYRALCMRIGRALEDELHYGTIREQDKKLYDNLRKEAKKKFAMHVKRKVVNYNLTKRDLGNNDPWPEKDTALVGAQLVEILIQLGLVNKRTATMARGKKMETYVYATAATLEWIEQRKESAEVLRPIYEPMIVPPMDWSDPYNGAYLTNRVRPVYFVKATNRSYLESLADLEVDEVYAAVNAAQRTAWSINPFILTVLNMAWEKEYSLGGIPPKASMPEPPKPHDIDTNEEARKSWRKAASQVFQENREISGKRIGFQQSLDTANRYQLFDAIYMPYQLDFRGRIYAVPRLNPQGPDWMKALLQFSEGIWGRLSRP